MSQASDTKEKVPETVLVADTESDLDLRDKDEALRLVGLERTAEFSDEYYAKVRRKLDWVIPPLCAAVYFTQFLSVVPSAPLQALLI